MLKVTILLAALISLAGSAWGEPLTLKECLERASASSRSLQAASRDVAIAREQIGIARSGRLPRVDLQGGYVAQLEAQAVRIREFEQETQDPRYPFLNLAIYDTFYDFGRTRARESAARMQYNAARHALQGSEQDLFLQVVQAYYGILEAEKVVMAADEEVIQMSSHRKTAQALFEEGVVTRNDLLQAEVRLAGSRQRLYSARNAVQNAWLLLNYLTGAPADYRADLQEERSLPEVPADAGEPDLSRRGEIQALRNVVAAGEYAVKEARTYYYPELYAKLAVDYLENSKAREQTMVVGTVGLKVNLFDGLATTHRLRQAVEARRRDEERLRDLEDRVKLELATARNDLNVAAARIQVTEKAIQQGVENLRITKERYQEQVGTATDVVDAQTLLTQTRTDYFRSIFDLQVAAARVKRATGEL